MAGPEQQADHSGDLSQYFDQDLDHEEEESVEYFADGLGVIIQNREGEVLFSSLEQGAGLSAPVSGFQDIELEDDAWRVFSIFDEQRQLWIRSAQNIPCGLT
ncbi:hypothetical protein [Aliamphritea spongicola]|nr:hypothetical protein [Aliamphritea spongicola]